MTLKVQVPQCGTADVTTDGNGDGTQAVTLKDPLDGTYAVLLTIQEADITGNAVATSIVSTGFTITVDGSAVTGGTLTVAWSAQKITQE